jgi:hypothetical protein
MAADFDKCLLLLDVLAFGCSFYHSTTMALLQHNIVYPSLRNALLSRFIIKATYGEPVQTDTNLRGKCLIKQVRDKQRKQE